MNRGQQRTLVVLALAVSIVTVLLMLPPPREGSSEGMHPVLPAMEFDEVVRVEIVWPHSATPLVVERIEGEWVSVAHGSARADEQRLGVLIRSLLSLEARDGFESSALADYGLDPEQRVEVSIWTIGGDQHTVGLGAETVDAGTYLLVDGRVLPAAGLVARSVPLDFDTIRDRRVWLLPISNSDSLALSGVVTWSVERADEGWRVTEGELPVLTEGSADPAVVLQFLQSLQIEHFESSEAEPGPIELRVELGDGVGGAVALDIYTLGIDGRRQVGVPSQEQTVTLAEDAISTLLELVGAVGD